jgi:hypothetical protein
MLLHLIGAEQLRPQWGGVVAVSLCRVSSEEAQMEQISADRPVTLPQFELQFEAKTIEFRMDLPDPVRTTGRLSTEVDPSSPSLFLDPVCNDGQA